jgi:hypothetical protein
VLLLRTVLDHSMPPAFAISLAHYLAMTFATAGILHCGLNGKL